MCKYFIDGRGKQPKLNVGDLEMGAFEGWIRRSQALLRVQKFDT